MEKEAENMDKGVAEHKEDAVNSTYHCQFVWEHSIHSVNC